MKFLTAVTGLVAAASAVSAAPRRIAIRQAETPAPPASDPINAIVYSPSNLTEAAAGSQLNFTYSPNSGNTQTVDLGLFLYVPLAQGLEVRDDGSGSVVVAEWIDLPANLTAGTYLMGVREHGEEVDDEAYPNHFEFNDAPRNGEDDEAEPALFWVEVTAANSTEEAA